MLSILQSSLIVAINYIYIEYRESKDIEYIYIEKKSFIVVVVVV